MADHKTYTRGENGTRTIPGISGAHEGFPKIWRGCDLRDAVVPILNIRAMLAWPQRCNLGSVIRVVIAWPQI